MAVDLDEIATLASKLGPRPSGSPFERRAAHFVTSRLEQSGVPTTPLPVRVPVTPALGIMVPLLIIAASVLLARLIEPLGLAVSLLGLGLLLLEQAGTPVLARIGSTRPSHNVLGLIPAATGTGEEPDLRRVVLVAHLDTGRAGLFRAPGRLRWLRPAVAVLLLAAVAVPVLQIAALLTDSRTPWWLSLIPFAVLLGACGVLLDREMRGAPSPGASDNAAGVAALLAVARALVRKRPRHLEVWTLFTAGAHAAQTGMRQFLADNRFDPERTFFITVEGVGAGDLALTASEGWLWTRRSSPLLTRVARQTAAPHEEWRVRPEPVVLPPTEQSVALAEGYQALGIVGIAEGETMPRWDQPDDTLERIDARTTTATVDWLIAIIQQLDQEAGDHLHSQPTTRFGRA